MDAPSFWISITAALVMFLFWLRYRPKRKQTDPGFDVFWWGQHSTLNLEAALDLYLTQWGRVKHGSDAERRLEKLRLVRGLTLRYPELAKDQALTNYLRALAVARVADLQLEATEIPAFGTSLRGDHTSNFRGVECLKGQELRARVAEIAGRLGHTEFADFAKHGGLTDEQIMEEIWRRYGPGQ